MNHLRPSTCLSAFAVAALLAACPVHAARSTVQIAQLADNTPVPGGGAPSCVGTDAEGVEITAHNEWWRRFYFNEYSRVGADALIKKVFIASGHHNAVGDIASQLFIFKLPHSEPVDTIDMDKLVQIAGFGVDLPDDQETIYALPVGDWNPAITVDDTTAWDLVVVWVVPGHSPGHFYPAFNDSFASHDHLFRSLDCGVLEPTTLTQIAEDWNNPSFADQQVPIVVELETEIPDPVFCGGFEDGEYGACAHAPTRREIVHLGDVGMSGPTRVIGYRGSTFFTTFPPYLQPLNAAWIDALHSSRP